MLCITVLRDFYRRIFLWIIIFLCPYVLNYETSPNFTKKYITAGEGKTLLYFDGGLNPPTASYI
jgi:hypothetical protein